MLIRNTTVSRRSSRLQIDSWRGRRWIIHDIDWTLGIRIVLFYLTLFCDSVHPWSTVEILSAPFERYDALQRGSRARVRRSGTEVDYD